MNNFIEYIVLIFIWNSHTFSVIIPVLRNFECNRSWSYGSWINNYLCNQCLSPLMLWVRISIRARCTTLFDKACQWLVTGQWFFPGPPVSSINKTDRHDITELLLKVALNTIKQTNNWVYFFQREVTHKYLRIKERSIKRELFVLQFALNIYLVFYAQNMSFTSIFCIQFLQKNNLCYSHATFSLPFLIIRYKNKQKYSHTLYTHIFPHA